jgi:DNA invertase Pin-like site-specific DNA recombinase
MVSAISYLRVSGRGQLDGDGFTRQREAIASFAASAGYKLVAEFREEGISGAAELEDRPALVEALAKLASNGVRVVIVERADRLARELLTQESIIRQFTRLGARILTADGFDLTDDSDPARTAVRQMLGVFAEFEKKCLVLKLRGARSRIRKASGRCEGRKPLGAYEGELETLKRITARRAARDTFSEIAERLHAEGFRTRQGKPWTAGNVYHAWKTAQSRGSK